MKCLCFGVLLAACAVAGAQNSPATAHVPDGGTVLEIQSIAILPLTGAPFSATIETEVVRILADGTTETVKSRRMVARDSAGRIFQERKRFSPTGDTQPTATRALQYRDPNRHEFDDCIVAEKTCYIHPYPRGPMAAMPAGMTGLAACGCATGRGEGYTVQQEALGEKTIEGVDATGSREITTLPAGRFGSDRPEPIVKEFWYSPRLGLNLVTKRFDPRSGGQNFIVDHLSLNEPDPKLFEPPADYKVVRQVVVKDAPPEAR